MAKGPHQHASPELPALAARLRGRSRKLTGAREAILEILRHEPHPMSNKDIFSRLPPGQCDLATVYRSLHLLEAMNIVKRFDLGDGVARYELLHEGDDGHHHHLVCTGCAQVIEIEECGMHEIERQIGQRNGFQAVTHRLEFFGVCRDCAAGGKSRA